MAKKSWISVKRGIIDPKHQEEIGPSIWLFLYLLDHTDWEQGKVYGYTDRQAAEDLGMKQRTIRDHRTNLQNRKYITCQKKDYDQVITIHNWTNPRRYSGKKINPPDMAVASERQSEGSDTEMSEGSDVQSDMQSDHQSDRGMSVSLIEDSKIKDQRSITQGEIEEIGHKTAARQHAAALRAQDGELGGLPWEVPDQFRAILIEFGKVWTDVYGRKIMKGDKSKWIKGARFLHEEFGEGASEYVLEAGKLHYEKKDDKKKRLSLNSPRGLHYMVRELAYADAKPKPEPIEPGVRIG